LLLTVRLFVCLLVPILPSHLVAISLTCKTYSLFPHSTCVRSSSQRHRFHHRTRKQGNSSFLSNLHRPSYTRRDVYNYVCTLSGYVLTLCRSHVEAVYVFTQAVALIFGTLLHEGQIRYLINYSKTGVLISMNFSTTDIQ
jgi:hypothetical protein